MQETLVIPLFGRLVCSQRFPELFSDPEAKRICDSLDYDFAEKRKKMESPAGLFGALEVAQRQYDLRKEVEAYLKECPEAAVVNLGCGLDDTFSKVDNGRCRGYNLDLPDVIQVRNELLPAGERETNIACDLNDFAWIDAIDASNGAVFFAAFQNRGRQAFVLTHGRALSRCGADFRLLQRARREADAEDLAQRGRDHRCERILLS